MSALSGAKGGELKLQLQLAVSSTKHVVMGSNAASPP